jgi:sugar phosphate isomerase/epimerase
VIGIFAKTFAGGDPYTVLQQVRAAGFDTAHYNMASSGLASMPDAVSDETVAAIARARTSSGVALAGLSATFNMAHPDQRVRETGLRQLDVLAGTARALHIPLLTLCTGSRDATDMWKRHPGNDAEDAWRDMQASLEAAVKIAEQHDVLLGIEPERSNVVSSADKAERLLKDMVSDRLRIVFDPVNILDAETMPRQREIIRDAVARLGPHIIMAHAKDINAAGHYCAPGQGLIDFGHAFGLLRDAGFRGPVIAHGFEAEQAQAVRTFLGTVLNG